MSFFTNIAALLANAAANQAGTGQQQTAAPGQPAPPAQLPGTPGMYNNFMGPIRTPQLPGSAAPFVYGSQPAPQQSVGSVLNPFMTQAMQNFAQQAQPVQNLGFGPQPTVAQALFVPPTWSPQTMTPPPPPQPVQAPAPAPAQQVGPQPPADDGRMTIPRPPGRAQAQSAGGVDWMYYNPYNLS